MRDTEMWTMGQYIMSAIDASICNHSFWRGKHGAAHKYVEQPFSYTGQETESGYKESKEEIAVYEMKQRTKLLRKQGLPESPM